MSNVTEVELTVTFIPLSNLTFHSNLTFSSVTTRTALLHSTEMTCLQSVNL